MPKGEGLSLDPFHNRPANSTLDRLLILAAIVPQCISFDGVLDLSSEKSGGRKMLSEPTNAREAAKNLRFREGKKGGPYVRTHPC